MPAYPWLFEHTENPGPNDVVVAVPPEFLKNKNTKVVAKEEALQLVAYLQSLKQTELPTGIPTPEFLYKREQKILASEAAAGGGVIAADGVALYATHCQACHQENGEGLPGAFPPLKGSKIVLDDDSKIMVDIIMNGYNGRASEGYGPMAAVGTLAGLTAEEVSAIMNHEKTSWGNNAKEISPEEVQKIIDSLN
jgi:cytochrome c oxidase cbb3-type subunit 2